MSFPGQLIQKITKGNIWINIFQPVNQSNNYPIFVHNRGDFIFGGSVDNEQLQKLRTGEWEVESEYCPNLDDDIFYFKWY
jgi:hypothetical protein